MLYIHTCMTEQEYLTFLQKYTVKTEKLDRTKLPDFLGAFVYDGLADLLQRTEPGYLLLALIVKYAYLISSKRYEVETLDGTYVCINAYSVTFMRSGTGKDKTIRYLNEYVFKDFFDALFEEIQRLQTKLYNSVVEEAHKRFPGSAAEREKYIERNAPRSLTDVEFNELATIEGVHADRLELQKLGVGTMMFKVDELSQSMLTLDAQKLNLLSYMNTIYDTGSSPGKKIKSERQVQSVERVPCNAMLHTSYVGLHEGTAREQVLRLFNTGLARRSLVYFPDPAGTTISETSAVEDYEHMKSRRNIGFEAMEVIKGHTNFVYEQLCKKYSAIPSRVRHTPESEKELHSYELMCIEKARRIETTYENEGLAQEITSRAYKANKIAGVIALVEHPEEKELSKQDVKQAIYLVEYYGQFTAKFYANDQPTEGEKLYKYLKNRGDEFTTRGQIRSAGFVHKDKFKIWFEEAYQELAQICAEEGCTIEIQGAGQRSKYKLIQV